MEQQVQQLKCNNVYFKVFHESGLSHLQSQKGRSIEPLMVASDLLPNINQSTAPSKDAESFDVPTALLCVKTGKAHVSPFLDDFSTIKHCTIANDCVEVSKKPDNGPRYLNTSSAVEYVVHCSKTLLLPLLFALGNKCNGVQLSIVQNKTALLFDKCDAKSSTALFTRRLLHVPVPFLQSGAFQEEFSRRRTTTTRCL